MGTERPQTRTMQLTDGLSELANLIDAVGRGETRVLVERAGGPAVAVISARDLAWLEQAKRRWDETTRQMEQFSAAFADVPVEELEAKINEIIAEGRARNAIERRSA